MFFRDVGFDFGKQHSHIIWLFFYGKIYLQEVVLKSFDVVAVLIENFIDFEIVDVVNYIVRLFDYFIED